MKEYKRCCCGQKNIKEPLIINGYRHEVLGPEGNFCGLAHHHELRDAINRYKKAEKERDELLSDSLAREQKITRLILRINDLKELLSECAYSRHTQEAMDEDLFDRIQKVLEKEAGR